MKILKQRLSLTLILVGAFCFASVASAMAGAAPTVYSFVNGSQVTTVAPDGSGNIITPADPVAPQGKLFIGWGYEVDFKKSTTTPNDFAGYTLFPSKSNRSYPSYKATVLNTLGITTFKAIFVTPKTITKGNAYREQLGYTDNPETFLYLLSPYDEGSYNATNPYNYEPYSYYKVSLEASKSLYIQDAYRSNVYVYHDVEGYDDTVSFSQSNSLNTLYRGSSVKKMEFFSEVSKDICFAITGNVPYSASPFTLTVSDKEGMAIPKFRIDWISVGKIAKTTEAYPNQSVVAPTVTRSGYNFGGWYTTAALTHKVNFAKEYMPDKNTDYFAKWINRDTHIKAVKTTRGVWVEKWNEARRVNTLKFRSKSGKLSFYAKPKFKESKVYIKTGKTWKKGTKVRLTVKPGKTKVFYYKVVSEAGTNKARVYKVVVKNKQAK